MLPTVVGQESELFIRVLATAIAAHYLIHWHVRVCSCYSLAISATNTFPILTYGAEKGPLGTFIAICCHRSVGLAIALLAWRVRVSRVPAVPFTGILYSVACSVRSGKVFETVMNSNPYVNLLCNRVNAVLARACVLAGTAVAPFSRTAPPAIAAASEVLQMSPRQTVLLMWMVTHAAVFWTFFHVQLRDEVLERKAFLETQLGQRPGEVRLRSPAPMMLQMAAIQLYAFALIFLFGDRFIWF